MANNDIYAAIDLGSNSFHMLLIRHVAGGVQVIGKIKRRVKLAAGLDDDYQLNHEAMLRGWECLALFAERLQDIPAENIRVVGTATMRLAKNANVFISKAESILKHKINVISGQEEAAWVFQGVACTSSGQVSRLVIDIGGASTEVVVGQGSKANILNSLNIGCVTFMTRFFSDGEISLNNFQFAIDAASTHIRPIAKEYKKHGWQQAVGSSGTVQAIQEIQQKQGMDERLTIERLKMLREQAVACGHMDSLVIDGLLQERKSVFVSGLAILIALFETLSIEEMIVGRGALREGLIYDMLPSNEDNVRLQTAHSLMAQYHVDRKQAERVKGLAMHLFGQMTSVWELDQFNAEDLLTTAALIHEIGLLIEFKKNRHHAAYILQHVDLPGFSRAQQRLVGSLVLNYKQEIVIDAIEQQTATSVKLAVQLTRLLRLAVILAQRRRDDVLPTAKIAEKGGVLKLTLPKKWLHEHPLIKSELLQEQQLQSALGWKFSF